MLMLVHGEWELHLNNFPIPKHMATLTTLIK